MEDPLHPKNETTSQLIFQTQRNQQSWTQDRNLTAWKSRVNGSAAGQTLDDLIPWLTYNLYETLTIKPQAHRQIPWRTPHLNQKSADPSTNREQPSPPDPQPNRRNAQGLILTLPNPQENSFVKAHHPTKNTRGHFSPPAEAILALHSTVRQAQDQQRDVQPTPEQHPWVIAGVLSEAKRGAAQAKTVGGGWREREGATCDWDY